MLYNTVRPVLLTFKRTPAIVSSKIINARVKSPPARWLLGIERFLELYVDLLLVSGSSSLPAASLWSPTNEDSRVVRVPRTQTAASMHTSERPSALRNILSLFSVRRRLSRHHFSLYSMWCICILSFVPVPTLRNNRSTLHTKLRCKVRSISGGIQLRRFVEERA